MHVASPPPKHPCPLPKHSPSPPPGDTLHAICHLFAVSMRHALIMPGLTCHSHAASPPPKQARPPPKQSPSPPPGASLRPWHQIAELASCMGVRTCMHDTFRDAETQASLCLLCSLATAKAAQPSPSSRVQCLLSKGLCILLPDRDWAGLRGGHSRLPVGWSAGEGKQCCCCPTSGQPCCGLAMSPCTLTLSPGCCADTSSHSCGQSAFTLACVLICACSQALPSC